MKTISKFSPQTLKFLEKAGRQKRPEWLEKNQAEYEKVLLAPLQRMARHLKSELSDLAPGYNFPQKGIGRLKRPAHRVAERGGSLYKNWMTYSASRPRKSRFEHNPNLFFLINTEDPKDTVLVAGGLYMPSSRQLRALREAIARDASAFEQLFASKDFCRCFSGGFSDEKIAKRVPRGFDESHPRMSWIRLQAFFVWRPYSRRDFASAGFPELVARDWEQILKLNRLLERALQGQLPVVGVRKGKANPQGNPKESGILERLESVERFERKMDF